MKKIFAGILLAVTIIFSQSFCTYAASASIVSEVKLTGGATQTTDGIKVDIDNVEVSFVSGPGSRMQLPKEVSDIITDMNSGKADLNKVVKDVDLTGYNPLVKTSTVVMKDKETQAEKQEEVVLDLYVPNLMEGLADIKILYYDNATGKWNVLNPENIDYKNKKLSVKVAGSGTFTIIYKK